MLTLRDSFICAFSSENKPVARCQSGEVVCFHTLDCFGGQVRCESDLVADLDIDTTNPATGPLYVEDAMPGDILAVDILGIQVADHGVVCTIAGHGALAPYCEGRTRVIPVANGIATFRGISWQVRPMIGVIGTAPAGEPVPAESSFECGGNMDSNVITAGTTVYLPVQVPGALLALGDLHASMGDGEVAETGLEIAGEVTVRVRLLHGPVLNWPVTETEDSWYVNTNGATADRAIVRGYRELQRLLCLAWGWDETDACLYMSLRGILSANQAALDPVPDKADNDGATFRVGIPKEPTMPPLIG